MRLIPVLLFLLLPLLLSARSHALTSATTTTLSVAPGSSVSAGTPLTLQASVDSGGPAVTRGTVTFYDGAKALGPVQVVGRGVAYTHGTANLKLYLGPGSHSITAVYGGTSQFARSSSAAEAITVSLASPSATGTIIAGTGIPGAYTLTGTVTTVSAIAPTGSVSFLDQSNSNFLLGSAALSAASQLNHWGTLTPNATGGSTYGVVAADLNGDGIPDLVTTNYGGTTISVLLGNGDGTFQPHADYAVGTLSFGLAVGDLNGDGIPDVAVASGNSTLVSIFLGNGDGTLQAAQTYDTGGVPEYIVMADFNGDGILDLATCAGGVGTVSVLLGNGDGTFAARQTFGSSIFPDGLAVADFNLDGNVDLVVSNNPANAVSVFLGRGDGTFQASVDYPTGTAPTNVVAADLDGDGNPDLVVCDSVGSTISVLMGKGDGTFLPKVDYSGFNNPWGVAVADANGDGIPDVVVSSPASRAVEVFPGKGDGTLLAPVTTATGSANYLLALGDWNGDGVVDLAVPDISTSIVSVALGSVSATATLAGVSVPGGGSHNVVATYAGDTNSNPSVSSPISLTGTPFTTTVALNAAPTSGPVGQTFVLTANISPASSSGYFAGGTVTFYDGGAAIGSPVAVAGGSASTSSNAFAGGMHAITATYSGDVNFTGSTTSSATTLTVSSPQTITFPPLNPVAYGVAPITLNATASSGLAVTFSVVSGPATVSGTTLTVLGAGSVVIEADQAGNASYTAAPPVQRTLTVNKAPTTLTVMASAPTVNVNANVTFTATLASGSLPAPPGNVTFFDGAAPLASVPVNASGVAAYSTNSLTQGTHMITATYPGNPNFSASISSITVLTVQASQTITFPPLAPVTYGSAPITLNATASSGLAVSFSVISGPATVSGTTLTIRGAGSVVVQADQAGNASYSAASPVQRTLTVAQAPTVLALAASAATVNLNANVTLTAHVSSGNLPAPTGVITFFDGATQLAPVPINASGVAVYSTTSLSPGTHSISATYAGDANFLGSNSPPTMVTVVAVQTITFPPLNEVAYGVPPISLNATASSGLPVTFSLVSGQATLNGSTLTVLAAGGIVIEADQSGDSTYPPAQPVRRTLIVNRAASAVTLATSAASVILGSSVTLTVTVPAGGLRTPTGSVNFLDGSRQLGVIPLDGAGVATVSAVLTEGSHQIEAIYSGDANFFGSPADVSVVVVAPGYSIVPNPAALTVKLGQVATSIITITPVGGFKGQVSLVCGRTPQIATCSLAPTTVVLPGDDQPQTVQFTLKTSVISSSAALGGISGGSPTALALFIPFGFMAVVAIAGGRKTGGGRKRSLTRDRRRWIRARSLGRITLLALLLGLAGCGGGHTDPFGNWIIVMTATTAGGEPHNVNINLTITP